ncbi:unnamed protein product [Rotaria sp. Silwood1]|nr:unnamed protein product [Rotaria sp. Silwood1]CAF3568024.1 unnamed protein product [Rotaria sp. Silwood1]CAF3668404.1 unnamed protein product [Rotaria sp. Silwood1]CAF3687498.1 unnamed protein product [Rotaria sp. Silwood1]CAF4564678.1 unnamed protein product [Rotaria sp. Silwood1]
MFSLYRSSFQQVTTPSHPHLTHTRGPHQTSEQLLDTINKLLDRLSSVEPFCLEELEQWRNTAYQSIDQYCEKKRHDLIEKRQEKHQINLSHFQNEVNQLIKEPNLTENQYSSIQHDIQLEEIKLNEFEHFRLTLSPLIIDENLVVQQHIFPLSHPYRTIHMKNGIESTIAANDKYLLIDREDKSLCLLDRNLNIVNETSFTHNGVRSICWSSTINRFIIITLKEILTLDANTMTLENCSISFSENWWRGTCSEDNLFLSTVEWGSPIYEFNLRSSFKFIKKWHSPITCETNEVICDLKYKNSFLAMPIFNELQEESRIDLRSSTTFECIWSVRIHGRCRCCSINVDQWLVMDQLDGRFFHISDDGKLLKSDKYHQHERVVDILLWGENDMVVLTKKSVNLHEL